MSSLAVILAAPVLSPLALAAMFGLFALVAWLSVRRVPSRVRAGFAMALVLAVVVATASGDIIFDRCAGCYNGILPEWWCWLNFCW